MRGMIELYLYKFSSAEVGKFFERIKPTEGRLHSKHHEIPKYTINTNENPKKRGEIMNTIIESEFYLQFVSEHNKGDYYVFEIHPIGGVIDDEMNNIGVEEFFSDVDLLGIFDKLKPYSYDDYGHYVSQPTTYLVVDFIYSTYDTEYGLEHDMEIEFIGYMDNKLNIVNTDLSDSVILNGECEICGEMTSVLSGNPSKWPIKLPKPNGNGKQFFYHQGCVVDKLNSK